MEAYPVGRRHLQKNSILHMIGGREQMPLQIKYSHSFDEEGLP
jgi:hypothetical protein